MPEAETYFFTHLQCTCIYWRNKLYSLWISFVNLATIFLKITHILPFYWDIRRQSNFFYELIFMSLRYISFLLSDGIKSLAEFKLIKTSMKLSNNLLLGFTFWYVKLSPMIICPFIIYIYHNLPIVVMIFKYNVFFFSVADLCHRFTQNLVEKKQVKYLIQIFPIDLKWIASIVDMGYKIWVDKFKKKM